MWIVGEYDRADILRRVRHLAPSWGFRAQFGYQNQPFEGAMGERGKMQSSKELRVVHARRRRPFFRETQPFRLRIE
jgi:hypothetical protein